MAADYIAIDRSKQHGNASVRAANLLQEAQDLVENLEANAQRMWDTGDHTLLEAQFGLGAGKGANFLTLLGLVKTQLANATLQEFINRVAGQ